MVIMVSLCSFSVDGNAHTVDVGFCSHWFSFRLHDDGKKENTHIIADNVLLLLRFN
jgi:hypothetical protein